MATARTYHHGYHATRNPERQLLLDDSVIRQARLDAVVSEPSLDALITAVETTAPDTTPLDRLATARRLADTLRARSDELLDHYVDAAREANCSWTEIGCTLGVTEQAAQQRYVALTPPAPGDLPSGLTGAAAIAFLTAGETARAHLARRTPPPQALAARNPADPRHPRLTLRKTRPRHRHDRHAEP